MNSTAVQIQYKNPKVHLAQKGEQMPLQPIKEIIDNLYQNNQPAKVGFPYLKTNADAIIKYSHGIPTELIANEGTIPLNGFVSNGELSDILTAKAELEKDYIVYHVVGVEKKEPYSLLQHPTLQYLVIASKRSEGEVIDPEVN